jgi:hypothetical protein
MAIIIKLSLINVFSLTNYKQFDQKFLSDYYKKIKTAQKAVIYFYI